MLFELSPWGLSKFTYTSDSWLDLPRPWCDIDVACQLYIVEVFIEQERHTQSTRQAGERWWLMAQKAEPRDPALNLVNQTRDMSPDLTWL